MKPKLEIINCIFWVWFRQINKGTHKYNQQNDMHKKD